jgi:hypothetical protein
VVVQEVVELEVAVVAPEVLEPVQELVVEVLRLKVR